jgi:hypothetical protein
LGASYPKGARLFFIAMATLWQILSTENKNKLADFYEEKFGRAFIPPGREERAIQLQGKLENLDEIDKLMRQKPHGRMGRG